MVSDTVLGAVIGVSGAVVGSLLTGIFNWITTRQRVQAEDNRRYAEFYMNHKVECLNELHSNLVQAEQYFILSAIVMEDSGEIPKEGESQEKVTPDDLYSMAKSYQLCIANASVYLNDSQESKLRETAGAFWDMFEKLDEGSDVDYDEIEELGEITNTARQVLEEEISDPVKRLEGS